MYEYRRPSTVGYLTPTATSGRKKTSGLKKKICCHQLRCRWRNVCILCGNVIYFRILCNIEIDLEVYMCIMLQKKNLLEQVLQDRVFRLQTKMLLNVIQFATVLKIYIFSIDTMLLCIWVPNSRYFERRVFLGN